MEAKAPVPSKELAVNHKGLLQERLARETKQTIKLNDVVYTTEHTTKGFQAMVTINVLPGKAEFPVRGECRPTKKAAEQAAAEEMNRILGEDTTTPKEKMEDFKSLLNMRLMKSKGSPIDNGEVIYKTSTVVGGLQSEVTVKLPGGRSESFVGEVKAKKRDAEQSCASVALALVNGLEPKAKKSSLQDKPKGTRRRQPRRDQRESP